VKNQKRGLDFSSQVSRDKALYGLKLAEKPVNKDELIQKLERQLREERRQ